MPAPPTSIVSLMHEVPADVPASVTPLSYDLRIYSTADWLRNPRPPTIASYAFVVRSHRLSRSIP